MLDDDTGTNWTIPGGGSPSIVLALPQDYDLSALVYTHGSTTSNYLTNYQVYVSKDGANWGNPVATGVISHNAAVQVIRFAQPKQAKYVKLVYVGAGGGGSISTASLGLLGVGASTQVLGSAPVIITPAAPIVLPPAPKFTMPPDPSGIGCCFAATPPLGHGNVYYVGAYGSDDNSCEQAMNINSKVLANPVPPS